MKSNLVTCLMFGAVVAANAFSTHEAHAQASECVPACRKGYVCVQGGCVSACNPPCTANQQCTGDGECVDSAKTGSTSTPASAPPPAAASTASTAEPVTVAPASSEVAPASTTETTSDTSPTVESTGGVHFHDGFYFRAGLGAGFLGSGTVKSQGAPDVSLSGAGPAVELAFGGSVSPGIVVGGGIYGTTFPSPSASAGGGSTTTGAAVATSIGPFLDWYFDAAKGLHAQAAIGLAVVSAGKGDIYPPKDESGTGFMFMAGLGYEWWVGDQLSLGLLARIQYMTASVKGDGDSSSSDVSLFIPGILASLTYQ